MTFKEAFAKARKEKGAGATFTWNGKSYTTDYAEDKKSSSSRPKKRPSPTRPKARPEPTRPKKNPKKTSKPKVQAMSSPKKESSGSAPKTSPRPKNATWPRVRNSTRRSAESDSGNRRQTAGENVRNFFGTVAKRVKEDLKRPNRIERLATAKGRRK